MSLSAGTQFGCYEVLSPLGAGGMGENYRAQDTRLHRDVAIKVLPDSVASDPEGRSRSSRAGALPVPRALMIAQQIADALDAGS